MTARTLVIVALLVAGVELTAQRSPYVSPVGVLVGIHKRGDSDPVSARPVPSSLRTVWLETDGAATPVLPRLLVPRSSGFWWLGLISTCSEQAREGLNDAVTGVEVEIGEIVWSAPIGVRPIPEDPAEWNCRSADRFCATQYGTDIYWVWPDFISISSVSESGCGAHPGDTYAPAVHRLDDLETPVTVGAVFGRSAETRMRRAYDRAKLEYRARHRDDCEDLEDFSPSAWHIDRRAGRWFLEGWADTSRLCEAGIDYSADVDFSRITGSRVRQRPLARRAAGVTDAIESVDGRWILVIRQDEVALSPREAPDKPIATAPLSVGDSVVMAEWAHGPNVSRWREQLRTLAEP
jgi:hypothetical protein